MAKIVYFISFLTLICSLLFQPTDSKAAPSCKSLFKLSIDLSENTTLLDWDGQIDLRRDRADFKSLSGFSYSYTTKNDAIKYLELSEKIFSNLDSAEKKAIDFYTQMSGSEHAKINLSMNEKYSFLNSKNKENLVKNLISAFNKGVFLPKGLLLFRGIGSEIELNQVGKSVIWNRFTSTSMDPEIARYFVDQNQNENHKYILILEIAESVPALLSKNPKEMEFLLPPGLRYQIVSKKLSRTENITVVHAKIFQK